MKTGISMVELNHKRKVKAANQRELIKQQEAKIINQREIIKGLQGKNEWISVEDELPELCGSKDYNMHVVCLLDSGERQVCYMLEPDVWESYEVNRSNADITHWMPLPKPPAEI